MEEEKYIKGYTLESALSNTPPGWENLVRFFYRELATLVKGYYSFEDEVPEQVEIHQVKEKFNMLRLYVGPVVKDDNLNVRVLTLCRTLEHLSALTCESCGILMIDSSSRLCAQCCIIYNRKL